MTPVDHYPAIYEIMMSPNEGRGEAGTFNSTTVTAATVFQTGESISDRHHVMRFWDTFTDGAIWQHTLDTRYTGSGDIYVDVYWTSDTSTTGNVYLEAGLSQSGSDGVLGDDTDTEYISFAAYAGPTSVTEVIKTTFTFDGTLHSGTSAGDTIAFILMRDAAHASDTTNDQMKVTAIAFRYNIDKLGV